MAYAKPDLKPLSAASENATCSPCPRTRILGLDVGLETRYRCYEWSLPIVGG